LIRIRSFNLFPRHTAGENYYGRLCVNKGLDWKDVEHVLDERNEKIGNLKQFHTVDKNT